MNENNNNRQMTFFDVSKFEINNINEHYQDLPEYNNVNIPKPEIVATFKFRTKEDFDLFHSVIKKELYGKRATMTMSGGNEQIYNDTNNRREFAESLQQQHPDVCRVVWRFNRWHHQVNYKPFKNNKLIKKKGLTIPECVNNYGMKLIKINNQ